MNERNKQEKINFGRKYARIKNPILLKIDIKNNIIAIILCLFILIGITTGLMIGTLKLSVTEVFNALLGNESKMLRTVVFEWRLPRVLAAVVFGASLAVGGAIFQTITKNPLGSPDIIGFTTGSYTGALLAMIIFKMTSFIGISFGALLGGFATAIIIYLLSLGRGTQGFRLIIVGVSISAMLGSLNSMLLIKSKHEVALTAAFWGAGSLNGITWGQAIYAIIAIILLIIVAILMNRALIMLELGRDISKSLGVSVERTQIILIVLCVSLTAIPTAVMGPVAFVALSAPQIANRLTKTTGRIIVAALTGSILLLYADIVAQSILSDKILPVGVVTLSLGGIYLIILLFRQARRDVT